MAKVRVRLLKPLNGREIGSEVDYDRKEIKRLIALGAVAEIRGKGAAKAKAPAVTKAEAKPTNKMEPTPDNKSGAETNPAAEPDAAAKAAAEAAKA